MTVFVHRPGHPQANEHGMVDRDLVVEENYGASAYVISDTMEATRHMATGKYHTSKSEFRKDTRASGCIEVGNETATLTKPRKQVEMSREQRRNNIRQAINYLRSK
jgi:hypothetical protein